MVQWIRPDAPARTVTASPAAGPAAARPPGGLRFGVLDNSKSNADHLLARIVAGLGRETPIASVVSLRKHSPAIGATAEMLDRLAREADIVVTAMAD